MPNSRLSRKSAISFPEKALHLAPFQAPSQPSKPVLQNITPLEKSPDFQRKKLALLSEIDGKLNERHSQSEAVRSTAPTSFGAIGTRSSWV